jgi:TolA-binding protein
LKQHPQLAEDPRIKPLLDLGMGIYYSNYVDRNAVNVKLAQQTKQLIESVSQLTGVQNQASQVRNDLIHIATQQIESTGTYYAEPPKDLSLSPPEIDPNAGAKETRQVAKEAERQATRAPQQP